MSENREGRLYKLLPAIYRIKDAEHGETLRTILEFEGDENVLPESIREILDRPLAPLQSLLEIIEEQVQAIEEDIDGLYDDLFIETCDDWVIPYIGALVGNRPLHDVKHLRRSDVAKTISYRRRKGTAAMLEEIARDVTGWGAHVVEFFKLLEWTQNLNHPRFEMSVDPAPGSPRASDYVGTVNLRSMDVVDRLTAPFDVISHTVDVRPISDKEGWHNIRNVGFFLWRLQYYPLSKITPRPVPGHAHCFTFSRLGNTAPLFNKPQREAERAGLATEIHVPGPIRPLAFELDLRKVREQATGSPANSDYYGPERGLNIIKDGDPLPPGDVVAMDLLNFERPTEGKVAIDIRHGLLSFAAGEEPSDPRDMEKFNVACTYGFSADIGGGPYERRRDIVEPEFAVETIKVAKGTTINTIQKALKEWRDNGKKPSIIRILDSGIYGGDIDIQLPDQGWLQIRADNGVWPNLRLVGTSSLDVPTGSATLILDGLLIEGGFELSGSLDLTLQHCTLVPGRSLTFKGGPAFPDRDSLVVNTASDEMNITIKRSIVGPLRLPAEIKGLAVEDSIVQAPVLTDGRIRPAIAASDTGDEPGPPTVLDRTTVFGPVIVRQLTRASEVIFTSEVRAQRQQVGCVRFSYVPEGSLTPRRYHCQPDMAVKQEAKKMTRKLTLTEQNMVRARIRPQFTSRHYGEPGYAQLKRATAEEIRQGAEDGSEMGAFAQLKQPQREANLRIRLQEYLPFGLAAGLIFVT